MAVNYRMRAFDSTLARMVFWTATIIDTLGTQYVGPGPLIHVVIQNEIDGPDGGNNSAANVLTWRPGSGAAGPVVFASWAALYAELDSLRTATVDSGEFVIVFDDVNTSLAIPAGAWNMDRASWISVRGFDPNMSPDAFGNNPVDVTIATGTTITNLLSITGLLVQSAAGSTTTSINLVNGQTLNLYAATLLPEQNGLTELVFVTGGGTAGIRMSDRSLIGPTDGGKAILIDAGSRLEVFMNGEQSQFLSGTVVGDGTTHLDVIVGAASAVVGFPQIFMTGTLSIQQTTPLWSSTGPPNGVITGFFGHLYTDLNTAIQYRNTDGLRTWIVNTGGVVPYIDLSDGSAAGVGSAAQARFRYNAGTNQLEVSLNGAAYVAIVTT